MQRLSFPVELALVEVVVAVGKRVGTPKDVALCAHSAKLGVAAL